MNTIFWVRHGENRANLTKEFSHRYVDYSLTPKGVLQAQQTARYFRKKGIEYLYSSPLKRARQTAEIIGQELLLPVNVLEEFREINVGALELQPVSQALWDFHDAIIHDWRYGKPDSRFPDGEDYYELLERMQQGLRKVLKGRRDTRIIIVGHGGILVSTICDICPNIDREKVYHTRSHNCSISEFDFSDNSLSATLRRWCDFSHLRGEAARLISGVPESKDDIRKHP